MNTGQTWTCVAAVLSAAFIAGSACASEKSSLHLPATSALTLNDLDGLSLETSLRYMDRSSDEGGLGYQIEGWFLSTGLGFSPLPFIRVGGLAGVATVRTALNDENSYGFFWGVNSSVDLFGVVLDESPVYGEMEAFHIITTFEYIRAEAEMVTETTTLEELTIAPQLVYTRNLRGAKRWHPYGLLGVTLRVGGVLLSSDSNSDEYPLELTDEVGLLLGTDMQFDGEAVLHVTAHVFEEDNMTIYASLGYYF